MKNQIEAKSQNSERVYRASGRQNRTTKSINHIFALPAIAPLVVGRGKGIIQGKAPPGSSGAARGHPPAEKADRSAAPPHSQKSGGPVRQLAEGELNIQFQTFNKNQNSIFTNILNFYKMKKQILFLVVFVLAALAGVNKSYGQTCTPTPLAPAPGIIYDYGVTITGTNTSPTFLWYVTTDVNLLTGTKLLTSDNYFTVDAAGSAYNNTTGGASNIKLVWLPKAIGTTFYLTVKYTETSTPGCTVENIKVFEIKPINTFLLAINASNATGAATQDANCAPAITGAVVTAATPSVQYTYGTSTIYYQINASGILGAWKPTVRIPALAGDQTYATARWSSDNGTTWGAVTGFTASSGASQDLGLAADPTVTNATTGSNYLVELVINNNNYETLVDQVLNVKVDGFLPTAYSVSDINGGVGATACNEADALTVVGGNTKNANYTITHRPEVLPAVATTPLIPKLP